MKILLDKFQDVTAELRENRTSIAEIHKDVALLKVQNEDRATNTQLTALKDDLESLKKDVEKDRDLRTKMVIGTFTAFLTGLGGLVWSVLKPLLGV